MKNVLDTGFNPNIVLQDISSNNNNNINNNNNNDDDDDNWEPPQWVKPQHIYRHATPLSFSIIYGHFKSTRLLLSHSAGFSVLCYPETKPLMYLLAARYLQSLKWLTVKDGENQVLNRIGPEDIFKTILADYDDVCMAWFLYRWFDYQRPSSLLYYLLVVAKFPPHHKCRNDFTLLQCGIYWRQTWIVEILLLRQEQDINYSTPTGMPPLHLACKKGLTEIAKLLIEAGANLNQFCLDAYKTSVTPLHLASTTNKDLVAMLIAAGADCDIETSDGETALYLALYGQCHSIAEVLLPKTSNLNFSYQTRINPGPNSYYQKGQQSLLFCAYIGEDCYTLERLLERINLSEKRLLMAQIGDSLMARAVLERRPLHVSVLIKHGANPSAKDERGRTVLLKACYWRDLDIVQMLLEAGADINQTSTYLDSVVTALHQTMTISSYKLVKLLLDYGADARVRSSPEGYTALHIAAMWSGSRLIVQELLLDHGAIVTDLDNFGNTPLHSMAETWYKDRITPEEQVPIVRILIQEDSSIMDLINDDSNTALDVLGVAYNKLDAEDRALVPRKFKGVGWNILLG